jgi:hypothetical protein
MRVRARNRLCQLFGARIGPAQVHAFGQDNESAVLAGCIANERFGSLKVGGRLSPRDAHLSHADAVFHNCHLAWLELVGRSLGSTVLLAMDGVFRSFFIQGTSARVSHCRS